MTNRPMGIVAIFCCLILLVPSSSAKKGKVNETINCGFNDNVLAINARSPHDTASFFIWANGKIPYYFKGYVSSGDKQLLRGIMREVMKNTCFKFVEIGEEPVNDHHLEIEVGKTSCAVSGFSAYVAPISYKKVLLKSEFQLTDDPDCDWRGGILHEMIHALGVGHTQKRADRDKYIKVNRNYITEWSQYEKCSGCTIYNIIPYDCNSIMHYGTGTFSNRKGPTMTSRDLSTCQLTSSGPAFTGAKDATEIDWRLLRLIASQVCSDSKVIDGQWSSWGIYGDCSATCGDATKARERTCSNPPPSNGGKLCQGEEKQVAKCDLPGCVIHGQWSSWGIYGDCSATCGDAMKARERTCSNPPPSNGGKLCQGEEKQVAKCDLPGCGGTCSYTDKYDTKNCEKYKKKGDCTSKEWKSWMSTYCEKTCNCGGTCSYTDNYDTKNCEKYKKKGDCTSKEWKIWMSTYCEKTCNCGT